MNTPRWLDLNADEGPEDVVLPVEVRVKQGMALLDEKHGPEWVRRIDVDTLNLKWGCDCVLGQLFGGYMRGCDALGIEAWPEPSAADAPAVVGGFFAHRGDCDDDEGRWDALTTAWRLAILARRAEEAS